MRPRWNISLRMLCVYIAVYDRLKYIIIIYAAYKYFIIVVYKSDWVGDNNNNNNKWVG